MVAMERVTNTRVDGCSALRLQEFLTAEAIRNDLCPKLIPVPYKWNEWWSAVAVFGREAECTKFGEALYKRVGGSEINLREVKGDVRATSIAISAMVDACKATTGEKLAFRIHEFKDVTEKVTVIDGQVNAADMKLGEIPIAGFAIFCKVVTSFSTTPTNALDLSRNELSADHASALVWGLPDAPRQIKGLCLDRNKLGDLGVKALCDSLLNYPLTDLDLSNNQAGSVAAEALAQMLGRLNTLTRLNLSSNQLCGIDWQKKGEYDGTGFKALCVALGNASLTDLNLRANMLDGAAGRSIGEGLVPNRALASLSLWKNAIGTSGFRAIVNALRSSNALTRLDVRDNQLDDEAGAVVAQLISKNFQIKTLLLADNKLGGHSGNRCHPITTAPPRFFRHASHLTTSQHRCRA